MIDQNSFEISTGLQANFYIDRGKQRIPVTVPISLLSDVFQTTAMNEHLIRQTILDNEQAIENAVVRRFDGNMRVTLTTTDFDVTT